MIKIKQQGWNRTLEDGVEKISFKKRRKRLEELQCHCCRKLFPFCWRCRCGFAICQACLDENAWGMTCNAITWQCPDCGSQNGLGNQ